MKTKRIMLTILIFIFLAGLIGCGPGVRFPFGGVVNQASSQGQSTSAGIPDESMDTQSMTVTTISPTQVITDKKPMVGAQLQTPSGDESSENVKLARQDLAQRLRVPVEGISVAAVIGQEFSNNAFYCQASKDRIAKDDAPAEINGFSILLKASGQRYEYHASGQTVIYCRTLP